MARGAGCLDGCCGGLQGRLCVVVSVVGSRWRERCVCLCVSEAGGTRGSSVGAAALRHFWWVRGCGRVRELRLGVGGAW